MISRSSRGVPPLAIFLRLRASCLWLVCVCLIAFSVGARETPPPSPDQTKNDATPQTETPIVTPAMPEQVVENPTAPCVQPTPPITWRDYQGPYAKTVGFFALRLQRSSAGPPAGHYKPGKLLCTLKTKDKFMLFVRNSVDPLTFLNAGYSAAIDQAQDSQPSYGQGFAGYSKRFGAGMA